MTYRILDWLLGWRKNIIFKQCYLEIEAVFILVLKGIVSGYRMLFSSFETFMMLLSDQRYIQLSAVGPRFHPLHCQ